MAYLDPDFRRSVKDVKKPFCCRCQKEIKDASKAVAVTVNWETWEVLKGHDAPMNYPNMRVIGNELMGRDCSKTIGLE